MASCSPFEIPVSDVAAAIDGARQRVLAGGGTFEGDHAAGRFGGRVPVFGQIRGEYTVRENVITFTITDRPMFVPCSTIEQQIRQFFSGG